MKKHLQVSQNQRKIVKKLSQAENSRLRWSELVEQVGLSRRALSLNLKKLKKKKLVTRTVDARSKEYPPPVYYRLQPSKLDLVGWFLGQLESAGVPKEAIEKGRTVLSLSVLVYSVIIYHRTWTNLAWLVEKTPGGESASQHLPFIPPTTGIPDFELRVAGRVMEKEVQEFFRSMLGELNPYTLSAVMVIYGSERTIHRVAPRLLEKEPDKFVFPLIREEVKDDFDKTLDWWFSEVMPYLPSGLFFQLLTRFYFHTFLKALGSELSLHMKSKRFAIQIDGADEPIIIDGEVQEEPT